MKLAELPVVTDEGRKSCENPAFAGCANGCAGTCDLPARNATPQGAYDSDRAVSEALLDAPEQVLSTLDKDGSRRWMTPQLAKGLWWKRRRMVAYVLMCIFVIVPHLRIAGKPLIMLDILSRKFVLLGHTFLPTDTLLVALLGLFAFSGIFFVTTLLGRAWCGWACPQTVYIEFLFRPIDRLFYGTAGKGGTPKTELAPGLKAIRFVVYVLITSILAHTFLAYFVGTEQLSRWLFGSPFNHPVAFAVMAVTTGLLTYDFIYFREQTCMIACPYGRFQSVLLDRNSLLVAYDNRRGEPRRKGKRRASAEDDSVVSSGPGDCVDCRACARVCPVGIDIRDGLQMECINCTQCIDACDDVMQRVGREPGLIGYASEESLAGKTTRFVRTRTVVYSLVLLILAIGFVFATSTKYSFESRIMRGKGAPYAVAEDKSLINSFMLRLVNRSDQIQVYSLEIEAPETASVEVVDSELLKLEKDGSALVPIHVRFSRDETIGKGSKRATIKITDSFASQRTVTFSLIGPR